MEHFLNPLPQTFWGFLSWRVVVPQQSDRPCIPAYARHPSLVQENDATQIYDMLSKNGTERVSAHSFAASWLGWLRCGWILPSICDFAVPKSFPSAQHPHPTGLPHNAMGFLMPPAGRNATAFVGISLMWPALLTSTPSLGGKMMLFLGIWRKKVDREIVANFEQPLE